MRSLFRNHLWRWTGAFTLLLAASSLAIHPFGPVKRAARSPIPENSLDASSAVVNILRRSCADCHSGQTVWPWYSYVAPLSWLVENDVQRGRRRLDFSGWDQYSFASREQFLADIASAVKNRQMPLPQYTWIHRAARLSDAETDVVYQWARSERRKLKSSRSSTLASQKHFSSGE